MSREREMRSVCGCGSGEGEAQRSSVEYIKELDKGSELSQRRKVLVTQAMRLFPLDSLAFVDWSVTRGMG